MLKILIEKFIWAKYIKYVATSPKTLATLAHYVTKIVALIVNTCKYSILLVIK